MIVREMTPAECKDTLGNARFGRLACALHNQPYVVPIYFVAEGDSVYSFSLLGQKIEWMRENPLVCLEVDAARGPDDWTSVVVFGRYRELSPGSIEIKHAFELLQTRVMWWEPGSGSILHRTAKAPEPVFYCICVERLTGRIAVRPEP